MKIRWKLLLLLLAVSLGPIVAIHSQQYIGMKELAHDLGLGARDKIIERAGQQLQLLAYDAGTLVRREAETIRSVLLTQAYEVEQALAVVPENPQPVFWTALFDTSNESVPGITTSPRYYKINEQGVQTPLPISYDAQVFLLAPGTQEGDVMEFANQLSRMAPHYKRLRTGHTDYIQWQYTALANGLHSSYPGHGGYPDHYDPRKRQWYTSAIERNGFLWNRAIIDAPTHQVVLTASMPVHFPNGEVAGVTAMDVAVLDLMGKVKVPTAWSADARTLFVQPIVSTDSQERQLITLAQLDSADYAGHAWDKPIALRTISSSDERIFTAMLADMQKGKSGYKQMPFKDSDSIWAYGAVGTQGSYLLLIVPLADITADALAAENAIAERINSEFLTSGAVAGVVAIVVLVFAVIGSRTVTRPIAELANAASRLATGDFDTRAIITSRDEVGQLGKAFNAMVPELVDRMRMHESLQVAKEVQQHLLPSNSPHIDGLDICGCSVYCDETGGDYFDYLRLDPGKPGRIGLVLGDVTGHGIPAALLMATARGMLRSRFEEFDKPEVAMNAVNQQLVHDASGGRFMTLMCLFIDTAARKLCWVNAGHDPAIACNLEDGTLSQLEGGGLPLGIAADWTYDQYTCAVPAKGLLLLMGTDGIWEARNPDGEMFGKDRLNDLVRQNATDSARALMERVVSEVHKFRQTQPQEDDITLIVAKISPVESEQGGQSQQNIEDGRTG